MFWATQVTAKGVQRVAFEVQWSRQSLDETRFRQERYAAVGIRGCWFLRPSGRGDRAATDHHFATVDKSLPVFALQAETPESPTILLTDGWRSSRALPLREFVTALLTRRVRFSEKVVQNIPSETSIEFLRCDCWSCAAEAHFYHVTGQTKSACGRSVGEQFGWAAQCLHPTIVRAALEFIKSPAGRGIRLGAIKRRYSKTVGGSYLSFGCPKCDALFGNHFLFELIAEAAYATDPAVLGSVRTTVHVAPTFEAEEQPHWCMPVFGPHCSERRS